MADILIIDDDPAVRRSLRRALEAHGHQVREAEEGGAGERALEGRPADLVVTDLFMPGKEGIETVGSLRRRHPELPILVISGGGVMTAEEGLFDVVRRLGADEVMSKPFDLDRFVEVVERLVERG